MKDRLEQQGVGFAANIPVVERSIVIAQNDAFVLVQTIYALAVAVGTWLPWICLALLAAGVFVAKRRTVALVWTAGGTRADDAASSPPASASAARSSSAP